MIGFHWSQLCPYGASEKLYCFHTHHSSKCFLNYGGTASCKSLISSNQRNLVKTSDMYTDIYLIIYSICFFMWIRIFLGSSFCVINVKIINFLLFQKETKKTPPEKTRYKTRQLYKKGIWHTLSIFNWCYWCITRVVQYVMCIVRYLRSIWLE